MEHYQEEQTHPLLRSYQNNQATESTVADV